VKRRLAILAVGTAMAFGSTVGVASATYDTPQHCNNGVGNGADCRPGKAHFNNDDGTGVPGAPGSRGGPASGNAY
jgi:hypothetical protein